MMIRFCQLSNCGFNVNRRPCVKQLRAGAPGAGRGVLHCAAAAGRVRHDLCLTGGAVQLDPRSTLLAFNV